MFILTISGSETLRIGTHTYPVQFFIELLRYVCREYGDSVWHALPKEVAALTFGVGPERQRAFGQTLNHVYPSRWGNGLRLK